MVWNRTRALTFRGRRVTTNSYVIHTLPIILAWFIRGISSVMRLRSSNIFVLMCDELTDVGLNEIS